MTDRAPGDARPSLFKRRQREAPRHNRLAGVVMFAVRDAPFAFGIVASFWYLLRLAGFRA